MGGELIEVNEDIHKIKRVNIAFDILHIVGNSPITSVRTGKVLTMVHDPFARRRGICLFKSSLCSKGHGRGRDKLHKDGRYGLNNYIEKQLVLLELESMVRIWGRGRGGGRGGRGGGTG